MNINTSFSVTDLVAWWGAVIATLILVWDIIKWKKTGTKLRLSVSSGMKVANDPELEEDDFIMIIVTNVGDRPTTITQVALKFYNNRWRNLINRPTQQFIIPTFALKEKPLPHVLGVGLEWMELFKQDLEIEEMARTGILVCSVSDAVSTKRHEQRIFMLN